MDKKKKIESFMLIGLSTFSTFLARYLYERNFKVIAVDKDEGKIEKVKRYVVKGVIGDATDLPFLRKAGVREVDAVIVSVGATADDSILIVFNLQELEITNIHVKVHDEAHAKILTKIGNCEVIFPEHDSALRLAQRIDNPNVLDYVPLSDKYSIIDWTPDDAYVGQTIGDLNLKNEFNVQIISIEDAQKQAKFIPRSNHTIKKGDVLVVMGENKNLDKLKEKK